MLVFEDLGLLGNGNVGIELKESAVLSFALTQYNKWDKKKNHLFFNQIIFDTSMVNRKLHGSKYFLCLKINLIKYA